ncbi:hypothetical protein [Euzebya sp.]|uniref:hypothetical protein n=1 Tax=Euzebya sp. TaxID=1971409 RepID=UPI00351523FC
MGLPRALVDEVRRLDEGQLRQLLILARGLLLGSEEPVIEVSDLPGMPTVRYRQKRVACGKAACSSCPHGPYWYAHWTEDGRRRSRYIGAELPADVRRKLEDLDRQLGDDGTRREVAAGGEVGIGGGRRPARLRLVE